MSIALNAKVEALEKRIAELERERNTALMAIDLLAQRVNVMEERIKVLIELSSARDQRKQRNG